MRPIFSRPARSATLSTAPAHRRGRLLPGRERGARDRAALIRRHFAGNMRCSISRTIMSTHENNRLPDAFPTTSSRTNRDQPFADAPVIFSDTRRMAIADGVLVDATIGEFADVSSQHFPLHHLAMTSAVFEIVKAGVDANKGADFAGIWHDILWMAVTCPMEWISGGQKFRVSIQGTPRSRWHDLKILFHGGDNGEPCATVMLPQED